VCFNLSWAALLHLCRREGQLAQERAEAAIALASEWEFLFLLGASTLFRGLALAEQGQEEEGIAQVHQYRVTYQATGAEVGRQWYLAKLAEAYGKAGQDEEGLQVLEEARAVVDKTEQHHWEAELYRIKGELTLQSQVQGPKSQREQEAEACFHKAIEIARQQQAKSLELRAVMSMSRLWQQQGKRDEAHKMLAEIYGWFTEGFDTKDLQEAKALLQELA
jgi:predicted ATPase